jgi:hypothetical protein
VLIGIVCFIGGFLLGRWQRGTRKPISIAPPASIVPPAVEFAGDDTPCPNTARECRRKLHEHASWAGRSGHFEGYREALRHHAPKLSARLEAGDRSVYRRGKCVEKQG